MQILKYIQFYPSNPMCCSDGASREENAAKLLKVAWLTLPLGIFITIGACFFVLWWQGLSYSNPYAQAIFINGTFLIIYWLFSNTMLSWFKTNYLWFNWIYMAGFACVLELLAEPLYILSQNLLLLRLRLVVETVATFSRCFTMCILIVKQYEMVCALIGLKVFNQDVRCCNLPNYPDPDSASWYLFNALIHWLSFNFSLFLRCYFDLTPFFYVPLI